MAVTELTPLSRIFGSPLVDKALGRIRQYQDGKRQTRENATQLDNIKQVLEFTSLSWPEIVNEGRLIQAPVREDLVREVTRLNIEMKSFIGMELEGDDLEHLKELAQRMLIAQTAFTFATLEKLSEGIGQKE